MKTKKVIVLISYIILGSILTVIIDQHLGLGSNNLCGGIQITHKLTYMFFGAGMAKLMEWSKK